MIDLRLGDCLQVLRTLDGDSIDAIVTDPPYGLAFMGKKWDYDVPSVEVWQECLRVLKPGGHLLAFAGTRTQHRMCVRIEDAGFQIRDMIAWVYGSGFPKSHNVSCAIDKAHGHPNRGRAIPTASTYQASDTERKNKLTSNPVEAYDAKTDAARQWQGWGTALKPALEPITVARKPLSGTVADNVQRYGTGAINVDGCRIEGEDTTTRHNSSSSSYMTGKIGDIQPVQESYTTGSPLGRWPANLIHDGSDEVVGLFPETKASNTRTPTGKNDIGVSGFVIRRADTVTRGHNDNGGSAARFFYCAKASKRDRDEGLDALPIKTAGQKTDREDDSAGITAYAGSRGPSRNSHPTVKPTDLMRYLCRLVTPPGGIVLDPFMGSGSTGKAAALEGFSFVGVEREERYMDIARARIAHVAAVDDEKDEPKEKAGQDQLALFP